MPEIVVPPAALLVIDVVEYTANSRFPSSCQTVRDALPHIARMLQAARQAGLPVFYSRGGLRYYTNKSSRLPDVVRGSWWWVNNCTCEDSWPPEDEELALSIPPAIAPLPDEPVIFKTKPSAFFGSPLQSYLTALGVRSLFVTGCHTSGCIRATVTDAFSHNYRVIIADEAVADRRIEAHRYHIAEMHGRLGWVVGVDAAVALMG